MSRPTSRDKAAKAGRRFAARNLEAHRGLYERLQTVPGVQLRYYLEYRDLPAGHNDTIQESAERFISLIEREELSVADVERALTEFREWGTKHVHLLAFDVDEVPPTVSSLPNRVIDLHDGRYKPSVSSQVAYSYLAPDKSSLRILWTETQQKIQQNVAEMKLEYEPVPIAVVLDADLTSGVAYLSLDSHGSISSHGTSRQYEDFYLQEARKYLGPSLSERTLNRAIERLEKSDRVRVEGQAVRDGKVRTNMVVEADVDLRQQGVFLSRQASFNARLTARYRWLPEASLNSKGVPMLRREITTEVLGNAGVIRFAKQTLPEEAAYVIEQVRASNR